MSTMVDGAIGSRREIKSGDWRDYESVSALTDGTDAMSAQSDERRLFYL